MTRIDFCNHQIAAAERELARVQTAGTRIRVEGKLGLQQLERTMTVARAMGETVKEVLATLPIEEHLESMARDLIGHRPDNGD